MNNGHTLINRIKAEELTGLSPREIWQEEQSKKVDDLDHSNFEIRRLFI